MEMLRSLKCPLSKQYRENEMGFRRLGGRGRGRSERGNKRMALFLKEIAKRSTREKRCLRTFHWSLQESTTPALTAGNSVRITATQRSVGVQQDSGI